jgi:hypothetical protein
MIIIFLLHTIPPHSPSSLPQTPNITIVFLLYRKLCCYTIESEYGQRRGDMGLGRNQFPTLFRARTVQSIILPIPPLSQLTIITIPAMYSETSNYSTNTLKSSLPPNPHCHIHSVFSHIHSEAPC